MAKSSFKTLHKQFKSLLLSFSAEDRKELLQILRQLALKNPSTDLIHYHNSLLFLAAHPYSSMERQQVNEELARLSQLLRKNTKKSKSYLINSGLPYTHSICNYSHDCLVWLANHKHCKVTIHRRGKQSLNEILALTLPTVERSLATAGYDNAELLKELLVGESIELDFYLDQFRALESTPAIKDFLFEKLDLQIRIEPSSKEFSHAYNRIKTQRTHYQKDWVKSFNVIELLNQSIPAPRPAKDSRLEELINTIKNTMALRDRETDPVTYLDPSSLRYYELDRGISIAIYGMHAKRQLPLESYIGFTLFKNGFPAAYGGCWVFGARATFGINIFELFRGGESGYVMCQVLRIYRQVFKIDFFEVEPYQFGLDNPEGIKSGAFWFYYKYGFRPASKKLLGLANSESKKIKSSRSYRSSKSILIQFTDDNIELNLSTRKPLALPSVSKKITKMIGLKYNGMRLQAVKDCVNRLSLANKNTRGVLKLDKEIVAEVALFASALNINDKRFSEQLIELVRLKSNDLYNYQEILRGLLAQIGS